MAALMFSIFALGFWVVPRDSVSVDVVYKQGSSGGHVVLLEVHNFGSRGIANVEVDATFTNVDGEVLNSTNFGPISMMAHTSIAGDDLEIIITGASIWEQYFIEVELDYDSSCCGPVFKHVWTIEVRILNPTDSMLKETVLNDTVGVVKSREDRKRSSRPPLMGSTMKQRIALTILTVLLLCSLAPLSYPTSSVPDVIDEGTSGIERIVLTPRPRSNWQCLTFSELGWRRTGSTDHCRYPFGRVYRKRPPIGWRFQKYFTTTIRTDIALVLIDGDVGLWTGRVALTELPGIEVRAHIPPSGFLMAKAIPQAIAAAVELSVVSAIHPPPLAFMVDHHVSDLLAEASTLSLDSTLRLRSNCQGGVLQIWQLHRTMSDCPV